MTARTAPNPNLARTSSFWRRIELRSFSSFSRGRVTEKKRFRTVIELGGKTATGFPVPVEVVESFGKGKKPPVRVKIGNHTYRSTVAAYGDVYMLPLSAENRQAAGVQAGDEVEVELALDTEPRVAEVPADLKKALAADEPAQTAFAALSYSNKRRYVLGVEGAKTEETRRRRIAKVVEDLKAGKS